MFVGSIKKFSTGNELVHYLATNRIFLAMNRTYSILHYGPHRVCLATNRTYCISHVGLCGYHL